MALYSISRRFLVSKTGSSQKISRLGAQRHTKQACRPDPVGRLQWSPSISSTPHKANMSLEVPTLVFPTAGPVLPPSPESTVELLPSAGDPRLQSAYAGLRLLNASPDFLDMHWWLYSALQNEETYPYTNNIPEYYTGMHMGDVLEPIASTPADDPQSQSEWILGWDMWCLLCYSGTDGEEMERNSLTEYPFCGEGMLSIEPLVSSAEEREWNGQRKWELRVPNETSYTDAESIMVCFKSTNRMGNKCTNFASHLHRHVRSS